MDRLSAVVIALLALVLVEIADAIPRRQSNPTPQIVVENEFVRVRKWDFRYDLQGNKDPGPPFFIVSQPTVFVLLQSSREPGKDRAGVSPLQFKLEDVSSVTEGLSSKLRWHASDGPTFREIEIDLKGLPVEGTFEKDAVKLDPKHNKVVLENDRVRIVHLQFPLGEQGPLVDKRPRVIILLTDMHAQVVKPGGQPEPRDGTAGTIYWSLGGSQATMNRNETKLDNIVVELKGK
jgi:hypothetical protein